MQTFLPFADFVESARVLDMKRLNKQQTETMQIINSLTRPDYGWKHHPAVKMWRGYVPLLAEYGRVFNEEWERRGYAEHATAEFFNRYADEVREMPPWLGDDAFHASHRSNLLRKDPEYYGQFGWGEGCDLPYVWPV